MADANNVTADKFSHTSNKQRENENEIFTSEKIYTSDDMVDAVKRFTINDSKYYESNTANASDTQCDITRITETVTHTRNGNFEQKILSYWTIPVLLPPINPGIYQGSVPIILVPQKLLTPVTEEVVADAASGGA